MARFPSPAPILAISLPQELAKNNEGDMENFD